MLKELMLSNISFSSYQNAIFNHVDQHKKPVAAVISSVVIIQKIWKVLKKLSFCGDSKNVIIKMIHNVLRKYLNQGLIMRSEFYPLSPWTLLVYLGRRHAIVNFGSYGTVPEEILKRQMYFQKELEVYPDVFYRTLMPPKYEESRVVVAQHVGCDPKNLVFVENITHGMNATLRSLLYHLKADDVIVYSNLAYSAVIRTINMLAKLYNVKTLEVEINFPIASENDFCSQFEEVFKTNTNVKIAIFDHISSASAVLWPIEKLGKLCKEYNITSIVDGAHAPGQLELNIESLGVDVYIGNLHKWYYCPKSCGILYADPKLHDIMQPNVISHNAYGTFHERFFKQGTKGNSSFLAAGEATLYMDKIGGIKHVQEYVTPLVEWATTMYASEWGTEKLDVPSSMKAPYMRVVYFPDVFNQVYKDPDDMILDMISEYNLSIFCNPVQGRISTRVSAQIFSTRSEYYYAAACIKDKARSIETKLKSR